VFRNGRRTNRGGARTRLGRFLMPAASVAALAVPALISTATTTSAAAAQGHPSALSIAMTLGTATHPTWWAPIASSSDCLTVTGGVGEGLNYYMPLIWIGNGGTVDLKHSVASAIKISNNDRTFTVTIGKRWVWSNGQPVSAQDVVLDAKLLEAASAPKSPLPYCFAGTGGMPGDWQSVTALNASTVQITLKQPANPQWFELDGLAQLVPLPSVWNKYPTNMAKELQWINQVAAQPTNPVYSVIDGPYSIGKIESNQYYYFNVNPKYPGKKPTIKTLIYDYEPSDAAQFAAFRTGQLQLGTLPPEFWSARKQLKGFTLQVAPVWAFNFMVVNFTNKTPGVGSLFNQLYIRQAMQYGIDQSGISKAIFNNAAYPTLNPVPTTSALYDHSLKNPYPYDPAKGKALLEAHGWKMVNGVMTKNGKELSFTFAYATGSLAGAEEVQAIQASWAKEGIDAVLKPMGANSFDTMFGNPADFNKWSVALGLWIYAPDFFPDGTFMFPPGAGFNLGDYNNPEMTKLVDETIAPGTAAQTKARFAAYERYAATQLPVLYVPTQENLNLVSNMVGGWFPNYNVIVSQPLVEYLSWK
jgi:peptide/nickel transport system substrate-binding protein